VDATPLEKAVFDAKTIRDAAEEALRSAGAVMEAARVKKNAAEGASGAALQRIKAARHVEEGISRKERDVNDVRNQVNKAVRNMEGAETRKEPNAEALRGQAEKLQKNLAAHEEQLAAEVAKRSPMEPLVQARDEAEGVAREAVQEWNTARSQNSKAEAAAKEARSQVAQAEKALRDARRAEL
jgi:hypothetical protein